MNSCIHSGLNTGTSGPTVWYNYVAATAGTIADTSSTTNASNTITATESICPKGWTLPNKKQTDNNRNTSSFLPVLGGIYLNGNLTDESGSGRWWSSEAYSAVFRYYLLYEDSSFTTDKGIRFYGFYIRCVSEEKDVSDLTYMQDMTPSVATLPTILQELCVIVNVLRA